MNNYNLEDYFPFCIPFRRHLLALILQIYFIMRYTFAPHLQQCQS